MWEVGETFSRFSDLFMWKGRTLNDTMNTDIGGAAIGLVHWLSFSASVSRGCKQISHIVLERPECIQELSIGDRQMCSSTDDYIFQVT